MHDGITKKKSLLFLPREITKQQDQHVLDLTITTPVIFKLKKVPRKPQITMLDDQLRRQRKLGYIDICCPLMDSFDRHVCVLNQLETADQHWNSVLVEYLSCRLDSITLAKGMGEAMQ